MHHKNIKIENFRGIKQLEISELADVNVLIGNNNCGKTSVLEAIFLLSGMSNPKLLFAINQFRDEANYASLDEVRTVFYNLNYNSTLSLSSEMKNADYRKLNIKPEYSDSVIESKSRFNGKNIGTSAIIEEINEINFQFSLRNSSNKLKKYVSIIKFHSDDVKVEFAKNYSETINAVYISPNPFWSDSTEKALDEFIRDKRESEIINVLSKLDPNIKGIAFGANKKIYLDVGADKLLPLSIAGDGIKRILFIVLNLFNARNGVLLIDEVDTGLHYTALEQLWKAILAASKLYNVQVFATTHSLETLKYLKQTIEQNKAIDIASTSCIKLRKFEGDIVKSYNYNFEQFESALDNEMELR